MPALTVFIDEAGDPGVRDGLRYAATRHEWLCVSAVCVRTSRDSDLPDWIDAMRLEAKARQAGSLHYAKIGQERREAVCASLATRPVRAFTLASHKTNMRDYVNERIGSMVEAGKFYNWCMRLLLERVTDWAACWQRQELGQLEPLKVVFARRGGHDYRHFFAYIDLLAMQRRAKTLFLNSRGLDPALLDRSHWSVVPAEKLAGLQMADTVASAFYQAANTVSPSWDLGPAKALYPIVEGGADKGLTVFPLPSQAPIPDEAKAIFRWYGYKW
ncbi:DUF3800 domain-containing protein [Rhizorhabdus wittichii]|uniref:DUF3800 domain-containing protein n=1 Tax=Rhizorhabdus wittichii TaxID=160791 RepID=A0A975D3L9_9SPHN|nr:DUF3800 domain-containing protein [Rhizorhabdus wittichii]QTH22028.1 DUF3800 domain-containing protein [Rhizorhabdus wittichii]